MTVALEEAKLYLRVDGTQDDDLITGLIDTAEKLVQDVSRLEDEDFATKSAAVRIAVLYCVAYLYEHRESADHNRLMLTLRALLFGVREAKF